jgi:hypothetical protein
MREREVRKGSKVFTGVPNSLTQVPNLSTTYIYVLEQEAPLRAPYQQSVSYIGVSEHFLIHIFEIPNVTIYSVRLMMN